MSQYAAEHASALADVQEAGEAVTFTRRTRTGYAPAAGTSTVTSASVSGYAIETPGNPKTYERLGLIEAEAPTLFFVPATLGQQPELDAVCTWADLDWTVRAVDPLWPDADAIGAYVVIGR